MTWIAGVSRRLKPLLRCLILCLINLSILYSLVRWTPPRSNSGQGQDRTTSVSISTVSITDSPISILDQIDKTELRLVIDPSIISSIEGVRCRNHSSSSSSASSSPSSSSSFVSFSASSSSSSSSKEFLHFHRLHQRSSSSSSSPSSSNSSSPSSSNSYSPSSSNSSSHSSSNFSSSSSSNSSSSSSSISSSSSSSPNSSNPSSSSSSSPSISSSSSSSSSISSSSSPSEGFRWHPISADRHDSFLFSAFYDPRSVPASVQIIGLSTGGKATREFCRLSFADGDDPKHEYVAARFRYIVADVNRRYAASFHTCYLPHNRIPYAVSLVTDRCESSPSNELRVQFNQMPSQPPKRNFTVCVTPLNKNYNNPHQLVEMIETNRVFGAQRFVFYNHSTGPDIIPYLRSYEEDGIVEVIPWQLPVTADPLDDDPKVVPEVHYYGQLAALNDCLYRNLLVSRFVVFTDLDELVVPHGGHSTWAEVLDAATRRRLGNPPFDETQSFPGAYVIQNTFFRSDWGDDFRAKEDPVVRELNLRTLLKTNRESIIYSWYTRSKCIVWTKAAFTVGIHSVSAFVDDHKVVAVKVDSTDALLHHYRLTMWPDDPTNPPRPTQDRHMHRFYDEVTNRTLDRHNRVRQRMDRTPVS